MPTSQESPDYSCVRSADIKPTTPEAGLVRRVGAFNDKLFLAEHRMEKGKRMGRALATAILMNRLCTW